MSRRIAWLPLVAMMAAGPAVAAPSSQQNEQANRSVSRPMSPSSLMRCRVGATRRPARLVMLPTRRMLVRQG